MRTDQANARLPGLSSFMMSTFFCTEKGYTDNGNSPKTAQ